MTGAAEPAAVLLEHGEGVAKDLGRAAHWYEKAAEQGKKIAQFNLGGLYERGEGVEQDAARAAHWYAKAAEQGDADAKAALERLAVKQQF